MPSVISVSSTTANGAYKAGDTIRIDVIFDEAVDVSGAPQLALSSGGVATYSAGGGTDRLVFDYVVQAGEGSLDLDYSSSGALSLNGGGIVASDDWAAADLTLPAPGAAGSLGANKALVIDTAGPSLAITSNFDDLKIGDEATITFTFSEPVGASFDASDISVSGGTLGPLSGTGSVYTATFTPTSGVNNGTASISVAGGGYTDAVGNGGAGNSLSLSFDTLAPAAPSRPTLSGASDSGTLGDNITNDSTPTFVGTSEAGATVTLYDTDGTTVLGSITADGAGNWAITSSPLSQGAHTITARATDTFGNVSPAGAGQQVSIDNTAPTATVTVTDTLLVTGETSTVAVTFSEAVVGLDLGDMTVANGALSNLSTADNITYTATLTPTAGVSDATNVITLDCSGVSDRAGNVGSGTLTSNNYEVRSIPTAVISLTDSALTRGETAIVTFAFSEAVSGFTLADVTVENGVISSLSTTDGGITWTGILTPNDNWADASNVITLDNSGVQNLAGHVGVGTTLSPNYTIDTRPPAPEPEPEPGVVTVVTPGGNVVTGDGKSNLILPSGGADTVFGGGGNDTVLGGGKDDMLQGNVGADSIAAGGGSDLVHGGQNNDFLQGNAGDDRLYGDLGADTLHGGQGADFVQGGQGDDFVLGDLGDDVLLGGQGDDQVFGGAGDDYLSGDLGADTLTGGAGADIFHSFGAAGLDLITDFNAAEGDRVVLAPGTSYVLSQVGGDTHIAMAGGGEVVLAGVQLSSLASGWITA